MKKIDVASLLLLSFMFISCDDFLDRAPLDQISQATFWKTPEQLDAYIVGKYNWLPGQLSATGMGYYISDISSDDMLQETYYQSWMNGENNTIPTTGNGWAWGSIRDINMFFDNYHLCESPFDAYKQTYGEACFLKALKYHELVMMFGAVPWYTHVIQYNDVEMLNKARDSRALVVDSIMTLIDKSVDCLKLRSEVGCNRLNKESALVYKSRVALYEATWAKYHNNTDFASGVDANKYFNKVIEAYEQFKKLCGGFEGKLYSTGNPDSDYYNLFNRFDYSNIEEVVLSKDYSRALSVPNNLGMFTWLYGYGGCSYTLDLIQSYLSKDGTSVDITDLSEVSEIGASYLMELSDKLDPRFKQSVFVPGDLISSVTPPYKDSLFVVPQLHLPDLERNTASGFSPKKGHNPESPIQNQVDPLIDGIGFRIPELMLNYVEAYVELNDNFPDMSDNIDLL
ncbi:MAG: RagB/SusD family nutrient uptake outer membrane protein, partial [Bacteroidales bacterium]